MKLINLLHRRFGTLEVIARATPYKSGQTRWTCRCDCGVIKAIPAQSLLKGTTRSCTCMRPQYVSAVTTRHGYSRQGKRASERSIWSQMLGRCYTKTNHAYGYYGGRGISVCERWHSFENFIADMGRRPSTEYTLDRINNDGNYEPSNCRWATRKEQANNRRPKGTANPTQHLECRPRSK